MIKETPWGNIPYIQYKKKIELNFSQIKLLNQFAKKIGIDMFVSCWDINSLKSMNKLKFKYNKIASAMITNLPLLEEVSKCRKKTFISTGMCTLKDVEKAVKIFKKNRCKFVLSIACQFILMRKHTKSEFVKTLKNKFKCDVGWWTRNGVSPTITAYFLGADYIERHITLDRASLGTDQSASLGEPGIDALTTLLRKIPQTLGDGKKKYLSEEKRMGKKMRYW